MRVSGSLPLAIDGCCVSPNNSCTRMWRAGGDLGSLIRVAELGCRNRHTGKPGWQRQRPYPPSDGRDAAFGIERFQLRQLLACGVDGGGRRGDRRLGDRSRDLSQALGRRLERKFLRLEDLGGRDHGREEKDNLHPAQLEGRPRWFLEAPKQRMDAEPKDKAGKGRAAAHKGSPDDLEGAASKPRHQRQLHDQRRGPCSPSDAAGSAACCDSFDRAALSQLPLVGRVGESLREVSEEGNDVVNARNQRV